MFAFNTAIWLLLRWLLLKRLRLDIDRFISWSFSWLLASQKLMLILLIWAGNSYFTELKQDIRFYKVILKPFSKTPLGETGCLSSFLGYFFMPPIFHPGSSGLWRSPPVLSSTLTTFGYLFFLIVQESSFFIHSFLNTNN